MLGFALIGYGAAALICFVFSLILRPLFRIESVKRTVSNIIDIVCDFCIYGPPPKIQSDEKNDKSGENTEP